MRQGDEGLRPSDPSCMDAYFSERISAAVPRDLHAAAVEAALRQGLTLADFVRGAVQRQLAVEGIVHPAIPSLRRVTFEHRRPRR